MLGEPDSNLLPQVNVLSAFVTRYEPALARVSAVFS